MRIVVGLGGNVGDVSGTFAVVRDALAHRHELVAASSLWRSAPVGPPQDDFLNAALLLDIHSHPLELLALCHRLEAAGGRDRSSQPPDGPRPLDLDLLIAERWVVASPALTLPHPGLADRGFALAPTAELVPGWRHPYRHRTIAELAADPAVATQRCRRLAPLPV